jgi:hypothetical protein
MTFVQAPGGSQEFHRWNDGFRIAYDRLEDHIGGLPNAAPEA